MMLSQIEGKTNTHTHYLWMTDNRRKYDDRIKVVSKFQYEKSYTCILRTWAIKRVQIKLTEITQINPIRESIQSELCVDHPSLCCCFSKAMEKISSDEGRRRNLDWIRSPREGSGLPEGLRGDPGGLGVES